VVSTTPDSGRPAAMLKIVAIATQAAELAPVIPSEHGCLGKHYMESPQQSEGRDRHSDLWADCR